MPYDFWTNTQIDIETARAAAVTINGITKANPAVVSYTGADPVNGDYLAMEASGMNRLNRRVLRAAGVDAAANTLQLEAVDSTLYDTFLAGIFQIVTFGVSMTTVQQVNSSGGDFNFADLSTIHEDVERNAPVTSSPFQLTLECLFNPADAAHIELEKANDAKVERAVRIRWPSGHKMLFLAYVGATGIPTGAAREAVKTAVTFAGQGKPKFYAT